MTPDMVMGIAERNAHAVELQIREAQQNLSDLSEQQMALEQHILSRMSAIAALHLEQSDLQDAQVSDALQARKNAQEQAQRQLVDAQQDLANALAERDSLQSRVDSLEQQARETLEQDPDYARQVEQLDLAEAAHREQISGYAELQQECAQKRLTFDANPLYCYLRSHGYATEQYRRNRLNRWMDNWLASKVNYVANRKNELSLIAMAERNETMQAEHEALIQTFGTQITMRLEQARQALGLSVLSQQLSAAQAATDSVKARSNTLQQQLTAFALNQDPHYLRARQLLTDQLKSRSLGQLVDLASQTPDEADDLIVEQLQSLHLQLIALEPEKAPLQQALEALVVCHERAEKLQRTLRSDAYCGSNIDFDLPTDFERLVARYIEGDVTLGRLIDVLTDGRKMVRRSQAAKHAFTSSTTTSFSFSTTTVSGSSQTTSSFSSSQSGGV